LGPSPFGTRVEGRLGQVEEFERCASPGGSRSQVGWVADGRDRPILNWNEKIRVKRRQEYRLGLKRGQDCRIQRGWKYFKQVIHPQGHHVISRQGNVFTFEKPITPKLPRRAPCRRRRARPKLRAACRKGTSRSIPIHSQRPAIRCGPVDGIIRRGHRWFQRHPTEVEGRPSPNLPISPKPEPFSPPPAGGVSPTRKT